MAHRSLVRSVGAIRYLLASALLIAAPLGAEEEPAPARSTVSSSTTSQRVTETLDPGEIRPEGDVGYVARLRRNRAGDKDSAGSECVLLEEGVPLPHPHARHADIRQLGHGRYSHWTTSQLIFSSSDSSDPRTNGRRYELVSDEKFMRKAARALTVESRSSLSIEAAADRDIRPVRLSLRNLDDEQSILPHIRRRGDPDLTSVEAIVASTITREMTDEQRAIALWKFLVDWRHHDYPAEERGEVHDPVKLVNVYGYGFCDDSAAAFCVLADAAGLRSRSYGLSGHVVAEAYYEGGWHMFDPDHQVIYRAPGGHVASVVELQQHPELITNDAEDPLGVPSHRMAKLYTTRDDNRAYQPHLLESSELRPVLGPGDQVVFDFLERRRVHRRAHLDKPLPRSFANGTLIQDKALTEAERHGSVRRLYVKWPYVILGGMLESRSRSSNEGLQVSASVDGATFDPLPVNSDDESVLASLDAWIDAQPSAVYQYWLNVQSEDGSDPASRIAEMRLRTEFQFAPRAQAQVKAGTNDFVIQVDGPLRTPSMDWKGMQIELVWDELSDEW